MNITQPMLKGLQQLSPMPCHSTTGVGPEHCEGGYHQYCLPQNCRHEGVRTMARNVLMKYYRKCNPCAQSHITHHCSSMAGINFLFIIGDWSHWWWNGWSKSEGLADPIQKQSFLSVRRITSQKHVLTWIVHLKDFASQPLSQWHFYNNDDVDVPRQRGCGVIPELQVGKSYRGLEYDSSSSPFQTRIMENHYETKFSVYHIYY